MTARENEKAGEVEAQLREMEKFLDGSGMLEGSGFGEMHAFGTKGRYWWRKPMHAVFERAYALLRTAGAQEWQGIESAPRDGTRIILGWTDERTSFVGFWLDNSHSAWPWQGWRGCSNEVFPAKKQPTHWQSMPPPPKGEAP